MAHNPVEDEPIGEYVDKDGNDIEELMSKAEAERDAKREDDLDMTTHDDWIDQDLVGGE